MASEFTNVTHDEKEVIQVGDGRLFVGKKFLEILVVDICTKKNL